MPIGEAPILSRSISFPAVRYRAPRSYKRMPARQHMAIGWIYFVSFIFLTAFAFLNMVIGIVVSVMEDEHQEEMRAEARAFSRWSALWT